MRAYDIILKKRDGKGLDTEEINFMISGFVRGNIPDYQISAFLMAVFFKGMTPEEMADLTMAMVHSGETVDLSEIPGIKVDKHSSGGVGDKTSLVLGPLVAAAGVTVAKMSGRGLGHTGGTLDKLESIPGFKINLTRREFIDQVKNIQIAIVGQTGNLVPADKKLYALRDVTATVDSIPLIASSIMSKKIAGGADAIVLDVKTGSGAFMKNLESSVELAQVMVEIGNIVGKKTVALISNMDQPLGCCVGNALEIKEVIEALKGKGPNDLMELCLTLGSYMLLLADKAKTLYEARRKLAQVLKTGEALNKFKQMIKFQGGNPEVVSNPELMPEAPFICGFNSYKKGYIHFIDAQKIGICAMKLGAGRLKVEDKIDYSVGFELLKKVGDAVDINEPLIKIHARSSEDAKQAERDLAEAIVIKEEPVDKPILLYGTVTEEGYEAF